MNDRAEEAQSRRDGELGGGNPTDGSAEQDVARIRWEAWSTWPLMIASALFLLVYSWLILEANMSQVLRLCLLVVLGLVWLAFFTDFLVRLVLSHRKLHFIETHPIDFFSVFVPIARPFRLLQYLKKLPRLRENTGNSLRTRVVVNATAFVIMFVYVISLAVLQAERGEPHANIETFGDAVWWACVTIATVGYGDYYPVTVLGRVLAVLLMLGGIAIVGTASATIVSFLAERVVTNRPQPRSVIPAPAVAVDPGPAADASDAASRPD